MNQHFFVVFTINARFVPDIKLLFQHYFIAATKSTCLAIPLVRDEYDRVHGTIGMDGLEVSDSLYQTLKDMEQS